MAFILLDDQVVTATLEVDDDAGNPVPGAFDAPPAWNLSDPDATVTMVVAADALSASFTATGKLTSTQPAQVTVTASEGGIALTGTESIQVNLSAAATIKVSFGTPAHK